MNLLEVVLINVNNLVLSAKRHTLGLQLEDATNI